MRGLHVNGQDDDNTSGIIPARAGFTTNFKPDSGGVTDHPRACGVYILTIRSPKEPRGSSPRVRGLRVLGRLRGCGGRIIPARAGFTASLYAEVYAQPDHPRACGVYLAVRASTSLMPGSSPRVRGLRQKPQKINPKPRIIPARAGFTRGIPGPRPLRTDHPRACGVYQALEEQAALEMGSSPRVRGLHAQK